MKPSSHAVASRWKNSHGSPQSAAGCGSRAEPVSQDYAAGRDPVSVRDLRRFENYCRWSVHAGLGLLGLVTAAQALALLVQGSDRSALSTLLTGQALPLAIGVAIAIATAFTALSIVVCELLFRGSHVPRVIMWVFVLSGVALALLSPLLTPPVGVYESGAGAWLGTAPWVVATVAIAFSPAYRWRAPLVGVATAGAALYLAYLVGGHSVASASLLAGAVVVYGLLAIPCGLVTWWMVDVVRRLDRARGVAAQLAVAEERLRFSRDLHDVFGRTLSNVVVKSELAAELARRGDARAIDEMRAVRDLAQTSLRDVRGVVRDYREIVFADEVAGALSVLRSAGIATRVRDVDALLDGVSEPGARACAWVVREAATNVLRHAEATCVEISGHRQGGAAHLRISNDITGPATPPRDPGTGLAGLAERVEAVDGQFSAERRGDLFVVEACVPLAKSGAAEA